MLTQVGYFWGCFDVRQDPPVLVDAFSGGDAEVRALEATKARNQEKLEVAGE